MVILTSQVPCSHAVSRTVSVEPRYAEGWDVAIRAVRPGVHVRLALHLSWIAEHNLC